MKLSKTDLKPSNLITKRDQLTGEIRKYWKIIATENIVKKGTVRNYDIKSLLDYIKTLYDKLINIKLHIQCLNMGINYKDLPVDANIVNVYKLSALNEYFVKLGEMMKYPVTLNNKTKSKVGKKNLTVTEAVSRDYFENLRRSCIIQINELRKKIEQFNEQNIEAEGDDFKYLTV